MAKARSPKSTTRTANSKKPAFNTCCYGPAVEEEEEGLSPPQNPIRSSKDSSALRTVRAVPLASSLPVFLKPSTSGAGREQWREKRERVLAPASIMPTQSRGSSGGRSALRLITSPAKHSGPAIVWGTRCRPSTSSFSSAPAEALPVKFAAGLGLQVSTSPSAARGLKAPSSCTACILVWFPVESGDIGRSARSRCWKFLAL